MDQAEIDIRPLTGPGLEAAIDDVARLRGKSADLDATISQAQQELERLKLMLAKARREQFGQSSERGKQLIEQLELAIEDRRDASGSRSQGRDCWEHGGG